MATGSCALAWQRFLGRSLTHGCSARHGAPALTTAWGSSEVGLGGASCQQRRWWFDVDANRRSGNWDKPAYTGTKYVFIRQHVPVVLLKNMRSLGKKGQIVNVKRGYARHQLVPKGLGLFATWENIDAYADPALVDDPTLKARIAADRGRLPFDWVDDIELEFIRWAREDALDTLLEPILVWDILQVLSADHELDLLPANVDLPAAGIATVGRHQVPVKIAFRNPESAAGRYTVDVTVVAQQSLQDELRREEMAKAVEESRRFQLRERGGVVRVTDDEEIFEDEDEVPE